MCDESKTETTLELPCAIRVSDTGRGGRTLVGVVEEVLALAAHLADALLVEVEEGAEAAAPLAGRHDDLRLHRRLVLLNVIIASTAARLQHRRRALVLVIAHFRCS